MATREMILMAYQKRWAASALAVASQHLGAVVDVPTARLACWMARARQLAGEHAEAFRSTLDYERMARVVDGLIAVIDDLASLPR